MEVPARATGPVKAAAAKDGWEIALHLFPSNLVQHAADALGIDVLLVESAERLDVGEFGQSTGVAGDGVAGEGVSAASGVGQWTM